MRIAHLNSTDISGGAAKAAMRLCNSLLSEDIDLKYFVKKKYSNLPFVSTLNTPYQLAKVFLGSRIEQAPALFSSSSYKFYFHRPSPLGGISPSLIKSYEPDLLHLHQINYGAFALEDIRHFNLPIIWTLHDCWPFTGGCHYPFNCTRFTHYCGQCPMLCSHQENDASKRWAYVKQELFKKTNITFIAPSQWMMRLAQQSPLLKNKHIIHIPNGINTTLYRPLHKTTVRQKYALPEKKTIILFMAHYPKDPRKGLIHLLEALKTLSPKHPDLFLLIVGHDKSFDLPINLPWRIINCLFDEERLIELINAADLTVVPSQEDNLPNVILESMSCAVPVISFNQGGIPEIITHGHDGLLCDGTNKALTNTLENALTNPALLVKMIYRARETIVNRFNDKQCAKTHLKLYQELHIPFVNTHEL